MVNKCKIIFLLIIQILIFSSCEYQCITIFNDEDCPYTGVSAGTGTPEFSLFYNNNKIEYDTEYSYGNTNDNHLIIKLQIRNIGDANLLLKENPIEIQEEYNYEDFIIEQPLVNIIKPGTEQDFKLILNTNTYGEKKAKLSILIDNDDIYNVFNFSFLLNFYNSVSLTNPVSNTYTNNIMPNFSWEENDCANSYKLLIYNDSQLSNIVREINGIIETNYTLSNPLDNTNVTTYYWQIVPIDKNHNEGIVTQTNYFTLDTIEPTGYFTLTYDSNETVIKDIKIYNYIEDQTEISQMRFKNGNDTWNEWITYSNTLDWSIIYQIGEQEVTGEYKDKAGNIYQTSDMIYFRKIINKEKIFLTSHYMNDYFGSSVAISNDESFILVGSPGGYGGNFIQNGKLYLFTKTGDDWEESLIDNGNKGFGYSISLSGNNEYIVVGSPGSGIDQGGIRVYHYNGTIWEQTYFYNEQWSGNNALCGYDVATSYDASTIVVGVPNKNNQQGAVFIFEKDGETYDSFPRKILKPLIEDGSYFGNSVDISSDGNTIIIGAYKHDSLNIDSGSVYVYFKDGYEWVPLSILPSYLNKNALFGKSLCISDDSYEIFVGAPLYNNIGGVFIYEWNGETWLSGNINYEETLISSDNYISSFFGNAVSVSEDKKFFVVGAEFDGENIEGSCYLYYKWLDSYIKLNITPEEKIMNSLFGNNISISKTGKTILIGSPGYKIDEINNGCVYLFEF